MDLFEKKFLQFSRVSKEAFKKLQKKKKKKNQRTF